MKVPKTLFYYLKNSLGISSFKRINKFSVARRRILAKMSTDDVKKMMSNARDGITEESYANRVYSKEGLQRLKDHIKSIIIPAHCRNNDFRNDPIYRKMMSDLMRERRQLKIIDLNTFEETETKRINDYSGVITMEEMAGL